ncbi:hypothetical protein [Lactococcus petauri]|uniref:hypothetical protein n=1 Tax=Lactococcus petauri TaxID=1940789 RepID=UPI003854B658
MKQEQKRQLRFIIILSILLLIGGTFAFTAFNQQAINDRDIETRTNVPGRIHDYYNRDTENKDVFAENYGHDIEENPIMVRIRLSEFMEIQRRGEDNPTSLVDTAEREDISTWTPYLPEPNNLNVRRGADSSRFNQYYDLTFGWQRVGQEAPFYMPTFNHDLADLRTAAAGHARDYIKGHGATDVETDGTTHPGDGTDAYWSSGASFDNSAGTWPGETISQTAAQHLQQDRPPMTIQQWSELTVRNRVGNYWVIDHNTGWAYWANRLEQGQATSYLIDAAEMREEEVTQSIVNGSHYYAIHVDSQLISPLDLERFLAPEPEGEQHDTRLAVFLEGVRNGFYGEDGNPPATENNPPSEFQFSLMSPGRIFTMSGQQYRYLENMGGGNHMIIRNESIRSRSFNQQTEELTIWYTALSTEVQTIVAPIASSFTTGNVHVGSLTFVGGELWLPSNLESLSNQDVHRDITRVVPVEEGGVRRAFALSLADVTRLSGSGLGFPDHAGRGGANDSWWWLRTPGAIGAAWHVSVGPSVGQLHGSLGMNHSDLNGGVRPALIIHQQP